MNNAKPVNLERYIKKLIKDHPEKHSRYSKQAWLYADKSIDQVFKTVQERY